MALQWPCNWSYGDCERITKSSRMDRFSTCTGAKAEWNCTSWIILRMASVVVCCSVKKCLKVFIKCWSMLEPRKETQSSWLSPLAQFVHSTGRAKSVWTGRCNWLHAHHARALTSGQQHLPSAQSLTELKGSGKWNYFRKSEAIWGDLARNSISVRLDLWHVHYLAMKLFELLTEEMPVSFSNCYCSVPQPAADRQCNEKCHAVRPADFLELCRPRRKQHYKWTVRWKLESVFCFTEYNANTW